MPFGVIASDINDKQVKMIGEKYEVNPVIVDNVEKNADGTEVVSGHIGKKYAPKKRTPRLKEDSPDIRFDDRIEIATQLLKSFQKSIKNKQSNMFKTYRREIENIIVILEKK